MQRLLIVTLVAVIIGTTSSTPSSRRSRASRALEPEPTTESTRQSRLPEEFTTVEPTTTPKSKTSPRKNKALGLLGFFPSFFQSDLDYREDEDDDVTFSVNDDSLQDEDLSRTLPSRTRNQNKKKNNISPPNYQNDINSLQYDSPIFYVRIPPTPYMFIPGLGYVSQPPSLGPPVSPMQPAPPVDPFINVPVPFVSNGKPTNVYQWPGGYGPPSPLDPYGYGAPPPLPARPAIDYEPYIKPTTPPPKKNTYDTRVTNLKGPYLFNGKPNDKVFVLRDSYNSLYADALQNFYP